MALHKIRVNHEIRAPELRVIDAEGKNLGVIQFEEALQRAEAKSLDLIEISPTANPPVAKIMDYGKFLYEESKKHKQIRAKAHKVETKSVQVTIGTGPHDLELKAKKISQWLREGHRIKVDLYLRGRVKFFDQKFLTERLERILRFVTINYKIADQPKRSPKGLSMVIEKS